MTQAILGTISFRYEPIDQTEFNRHVQIACDRLGTARFEALASEGRAIMMEQAIDYALELSAYS